MTLLNTPGKAFFFVRIFGFIVSIGCLSCGWILVVCVLVKFFFMRFYLDQYFLFMFCVCVCVCVCFFNLHLLSFLSLSSDSFRGLSSSLYLLCLIQGTDLPLLILINIFWASSHLKTPMEPHFLQDTISSLTLVTHFLQDTISNLSCYSFSPRYDSEPHSCYPFPSENLLTSLERHPISYASLWTLESYSSHLRLLGENFLILLT